jgi:anaphase-promoting complex subunit 8
MEDNSLPALVAEFPESIRSPIFTDVLQNSLAQLSSRGLVQATRWAAELLDALPQDNVGAAAARDADARVPVAVSGIPRSLVIAKTYFDTRQYRRCAAYLDAARTASSRREEITEATFLRCFAKYLCVEKDAAMSGAVPTERSAQAEAELREVHGVLKGSDDPHCRYLHAVVLGKLELVSDGDAVRQLLVQSVTDFPCNWAAWKTLATYVADADEARSVVEAVCDGDAECAESDPTRVARRIMCVLFWAWASLNNDGPEEAREVYTTAVAILERSIHLKGCLATALYHMRLFDEAQELFEEVFDQDEYNLDGVDTYSNILYVKEDKVGLSILAERCVRVDKFCVETCCVVGNYYSLRGQHEQAVSYFQRALKLNPSYLSAWTLMGHEYVEMKNTAAAVEAYRRAVDVSPKDFRAWYGLGQTYELLDMPLYTLYYYGKAAALRPRDARMWSAVGQTYEELGRLQDAVRAYERANACDERGEGQALGQLAALYERMSLERVSQRQEYTKLAVYYHELNLSRREAEGSGGTKTADAIRFLANHAFESKQYARAERFLLRLLDHAGHKDAAKTMLREIKALKGGRSALPRMTTRG